MFYRKPHASLTSAGHSRCPAWSMSRHLQRALYLFPAASTTPALGRGPPLLAPLAPGEDPSGQQG